jgi:hypothetical protein
VCLCVKGTFAPGHSAWHGCPRLHALRQHDRWGAGATVGKDRRYVEFFTTVLLAVLQSLFIISSSYRRRDVQQGHKVKHSIDPKPSQESKESSDSCTAIGNLDARHLARRVIELVEKVGEKRDDPHFYSVSQLYEADIEQYVPSWTRNLLVVSSKVDFC